MNTTYKGYGLEIYADRADVVRWGVLYGSYPTPEAARAFIDGRQSA